MADLSRRRAMGWLACGAVAPLLVRQGFAQDAAPDPVPRRRLGRTDMDVSVVGFGGMTVGLASTDQEQVTELLNRALDRGLNFIDTAECYGTRERNHSEDLIGAAISRRRDDFFLCTKVGHEHGVFAQEHEDWSKPSLLRTIDRSLRRLKTDRLDVVYLHGCGLPTLRSGESIEALREARDAGKVRYLGYSGSGDRARFAIESGSFDVVQLSINVFEQDAIDDLLPSAQQRKVGVVVKRPLGNAVWRYAERPQWWYYHEYWDLMKELDYDFLAESALEDSGPDGAGGVALRFVTSTPGVHSAIVGTQRPGRWSQNNANAAAGPLPQERWQAIRDRWRQNVKRN